MSDILSAISNIISALTSWRLGLVLTLVGTSVYLSKVYGPLYELDQQWYHGAIIAGIIGASILLLHGLVLLAQGISLAAPPLGQLILTPLVRKKARKLAEEKAKREHEFAQEKARRERELSLRNFETITEQEKKSLLWIKQSGKKRFKAARRNTVLMRLYEAQLLELDMSDREREEGAPQIHWVVPDHVWSKMDGINLKRFNLPSRPPWETFR